MSETLRCSSASSGAGKAAIFWVTVKIQNRTDYPVFADVSLAPRQYKSVVQKVPKRRERAVVDGRSDVKRLRVVWNGSEADDVFGGRPG